MEPSPPAPASPPTAVRIRVAQRSDGPAIVRLLVDDALVATRELPGEPLALSA